MTGPLLRRPPRGFSVPALLAFVVVVAALAAFPSFVRKPYVLHMGILLFKPAGLLGKSRM